MATLGTILGTMQQQVAAATADLTSVAPDTAGQAITVKAGVGWPSEKTLQNNVRALSGPAALVTIFDRGMASDSTRWRPITLSTTRTLATLTAAPAATLLRGGHFQSVTLGGSITPGDAVAAVLSKSFGNQGAYVAVSEPGDTPTSMATKLAAGINADAKLKEWVRADAFDSHVTITSLIEGVLSLNVNTGNGGTALRELGRRERHMQIVLWTRTAEDRDTVGDALETMIGKMQADFGLTFDDGTTARLTYTGDTEFDDATLADTYRRDFMACVEYSVTTTDELYAILAPILDYRTF